MPVFTRDRGGVPNIRDASIFSTRQLVNELYRRMKVWIVEQWNRVLG
jgi:hypothetical protein